MRAVAYGRVNLVGEHTDYNEGLVLPMPIPLGVTVTATPRADRVMTAHSVALGETSRWTLGDEARAGTWTDYLAGCTWSLARAGAMPAHGFDLAIESDLPIGAGLASSAALTTAAIRSMVTLEPAALAALTRSVETAWLGAPIGAMDNLAAAYGAPRSPLFIDCRSWAIESLEWPEGWSIVVVDSGVSHANVSSGYGDRAAECREAAAVLGLGSLRDASLDALDSLDGVLLRRVRHVITENARVRAAVRHVAEADAAALGAVFDASHASLRDDYEVSVPAVDQLVEALRAEPGVYGARMTGGGFGGCVIALVEKGFEDAGPRAAAGCAGARSIRFG